MKKLLPSILATTMALTMGVSAFADVSFGDSTNDKADWPVNFNFGGQLTLVRDDEALDLGSGSDVDMMPGDTLYLPLEYEYTPELVPGASKVESQQQIYKGQINGKWKTYLSEKTNGLVKDAELYRAGKNDDDLEQGGVYVKVDLTDSYNSVKDTKVKFSVCVKDSSSKNQTNKATVSGDFVQRNSGNYVEFDWSNTVDGPMVWEVDKGDSGEAEFHFDGGVTYTVKMYSGEKVLLNLSRDFNKSIANDFDADLEFYNFKGNSDSFGRSGILAIPAAKDSYIYEEKDGKLEEISSTYNKKTESLEIKTRELGSYIVSDKKLDLSKQEEEVPEKEQPSKNQGNKNETCDKETNKDVNKGTETETATPSTPSNDGSNDQPDNNQNVVKPNPDTGASDFTAAAVAMAILSMAAVGFLTIHKKSK